MAQVLGRQLVQERLAACVNIIGPISSIYKDTALVEKQEYVLLAKTRSDRIESLTQRVSQLHEYETPAILAWNVGGNERFLDWVTHSLSTKQIT
jgi:periplasmic divalent cation tolerance protein